MIFVADTGSMPARLLSLTSADGRVYTSVSFRFFLPFTTCSYATIRALVSSLPSPCHTSTVSTFLAPLQFSRECFALLLFWSTRGIARDVEE